MMINSEMSCTSCHQMSVREFANAGNIALDKETLSVTGK
jgi:hypothetical protein